MIYLRKDGHCEWAVLLVTPWISLQFSKSNRMQFTSNPALIAVDFSLIDQNGMHCIDGKRGYEYLDFSDCFHKNEEWDAGIHFLNWRFWVIGTDISKHFLLKQLLEGANPLLMC